MTRVERQDTERRRIKLQVLPRRYRHAHPAGGEAAAELALAEKRNIATKRKQPPDEAVRTAREELDVGKVPPASMVAYVARQIDAILPH